MRQKVLLSESQHGRICQVSILKIQQITLENLGILMFVFSPILQIHDSKYYKDVVILDEITLEMLLCGYYI